MNIKCQAGMFCEDLQRTAGSCGSLGSPCPLALISGVISQGSLPWAAAPGAALMEELPSPAAVVSWDAGEGHAGRKKTCGTGHSEMWDVYKSGSYSAEKALVKKNSPFLFVYE